MLRTNQQMKIYALWMKNWNNHVTHSLQPLPIVMLPMEDFLAFCGNRMQTFIYNESIWGEFKNTDFLSDK